MTPSDPAPPSTDPYRFVRDPELRLVLERAEAVVAGWHSIPPGAGLDAPGLGYLIGDLRQALGFWKEKQHQVALQSDSSLPTADQALPSDITADHLAIVMGGAPREREDMEIDNLWSEEGTRRWAGGFLQLLADHGWKIVNAIPVTPPPARQPKLSDLGFSGYQVQIYYTEWTSFDPEYRSPMTLIVWARSLTEACEAAVTVRDKAEVWSIKRLTAATLIDLRPAEVAS
jgi:hypothetical protein